MADVQIHLEAADAPLSYTVPNTSELIPKAVSAVFDGTGASGQFAPLVEVISDGGIVVAQSKADTVAAGGSAEVSWFQGVSGATSATATLPCAIFYQSWSGSSFPASGSQLPITGVHSSVGTSPVVSGGAVTFESGSWLLFSRLSVNDTSGTPTSTLLKYYAATTSGTGFPTGGVQHAQGFDNQWIADYTLVFSLDGNTAVQFTNQSGDFSGATLIELEATFVRVNVSGL